MAEQSVRRLLGQRGRGDRSEDPLDELLGLSENGDEFFPIGDGLSEKMMVAMF